MDSVIPEGGALPQRSPCRWLISLDFDGTLWSGTKCPPVPPDFFELIQRWRDVGVRWGINTGRTMEYLLEDWNQIASFLPDFICTCERFVYLAGDDGRLRGLSVHNSAAGEAAIALQKRISSLFHAELRNIRASYPHLSWSIAPSDPLSVEAADSATMDELSELLLPFMQGLHDVSIQRAGRYMRLSDARFNKGAALARVAEAWRVGAERILVAGDGHNDIDAFAQFRGAFCAAPADAHPEVIAWLETNGGYISTESGVMQILHHWGEFNGVHCSTK